MSIEVATSEILAARDRMAIRGANDREIPAIIRIVDQMRKGMITPEKALKEVFEIEERKMDYH